MSSYARMNLKDRLRGFIALAGASSEWAKKFGLDVGVEGIIAILREEIAKDAERRRDGVTWKTRAERIAYLFRDMSNSILELIAEIDEKTVPKEG